MQRIIEAMLVLCCLQLLLCAGVCAAEFASDRVAEPVVISADNDDWDDFDTAFADYSAAQDSVSEVLIADPFESLNRCFFWFNDKLYFYMIKPVAKGWRAVAPRPLRTSIKNVFSNLSTPVRLGNCLLQFKFYDFGTELYRFTMNSTFGLAGLFDVAATYADVAMVAEDFGQTLGAYGLGHGFYLVLPVVGPSSLRDFAGSLVDSYADPLLYVDWDSWDYVAVKVGDVENRLSLDHDTYEGVVRDSIDPYLFLRLAYAQRRRAQVGKRSYDLKLFQAPLFDSDWLNPSPLFESDWLNPSAWFGVR
jgi:phospholipid-binding lipoprotein MlaA